MMLRKIKIAGGIRIGTCKRFEEVVGSSKGYSTNNNKLTTEPNDNNVVEKTDMSLTHHDSYRDLDKLDFMTAAKILFTTPPKHKKFGLDFHLVQLFFVCLPSLAVYLVAQYARHEMKKMDAELEKRQIEEAKKLKAKEGEVLKSNPELIEMKERLDSLEKSVKEIVMESKIQRSVKTASDEDNNKLVKNAASSDKKETNGGGDNQKKVAAAQGGNDK